MFSTLHKKLITPQFEISISNLEIDEDHWHSFGTIRKWVAELELLLYPHKTFKDAEQEIIAFLLKLNKLTPRINSINFYHDEQAYICLCVSEMATFKPANFLNRSISVDFFKQKKKIKFIDITSTEWGSTELKLPMNWRFNEIVTAKYNKHKKLFL